MVMSPYKGDSVHFSTKITNNMFLDLEPATWYVLRITAHNNAGFNVAEYDFATLTMTGGKYKENTSCLLFKCI